MSRDVNQLIAFWVRSCLTPWRVVGAVHWNGSAVRATAGNAEVQGAARSLERRAVLIAAPPLSRCVIVFGAGVVVFDVRGDGYRLPFLCRCC